MTLYIPEFVLGMLFMLAIEIVIGCVVAIRQNNKKKAMGKFNEPLKGDEKK
jgi:hypothetical protein